MKSEKGVTLTALVAYIIVFTIILAMIATISSYFYRNVSKIQEAPKYISEFNKFSMFFIADVKGNKKVNYITSNSLEFEDGTKYVYKNSAIYRNNKRIARNVKSFIFTELDYTINNFTKKIINVNAVFGTSKEQVIRNIDFVLKYW